MHKTIVVGFGLLLLAASAPASAEGDDKGTGKTGEETKKPGAKAPAAKPGVGKPAAPGATPPGAPAPKAPPAADPHAPPSGVGQGDHHPRTDHHRPPGMRKRFRGRRHKGRHGPLGKVGPDGRPRAPGTPGAPGAKSESDASLGRTIGRLHPIFVHFPIAWLLLLLLVDARAFSSGSETWQRAGYALSLLTLAACAVAATLGLIRAATERVFGDDPLVLLHRNVLLGACGVVAIAVVLRLVRKNDLKRPYDLVYLILLLLAVIGVMIGAHVGGKVTFGEHYLPF